jgi:hypothetical protein
MGWRRWAAGLVLAAGLAAAPAWGSQPPVPDVLDSRGHFGAPPGGGARELRVESRKLSWWPAELPGTSRRVLAVVSRFVPGARQATHAIRVEEHYLEAGPRDYYGAENGAGVVMELSAHRLDVGACEQACGLRRHLEMYEVALPAAALRLEPGQAFCLRFLARRGDPMLGGELRWCVTGAQMAAHLREFEGEARFHRVALPGR